MTPRSPGCGFPDCGDPTCASFCPTAPVARDPWWVVLLSATLGRLMDARPLGGRHEPTHTPGCPSRWGDDCDGSCWL